MSATAWGVVVDALLARMTARSGYRSSWVQGTGRPVFDGADLGLTEDQAGTFLAIAWPGDPDTPAEAGQSGQVIATLGTLRHRQEDATVRCLAVDQRGDVGPGVTAASRTAALSVLDDVDAELRADPTLGLQPTFQSVVARIGGLPSIRSLLTERGVVTLVEFDVIFSVRI
jgi:hypothetical protein